jgi:hypothetical protein
MKALFLASKLPTKIFYIPKWIRPDMSRPVTVQYVVPFSVGLLVSGSVLIGLSLYNFYVNALFGLEGWWFYLVVAGLILAITGFFYLYGYMKRVSKFKKLIAEKSKKEFVVNLDELEYTAWRLPKKYEDQVRDKKKEFGVK